MQSLLTVVSLLLLAGMSLELRRRWPRLSRSTQTRWLAGICGLLAVKLAADAARWETTAGRLNDLLVWARIAGYILLVILFTRLRPRVLTTGIAVVLLLPLPSATIYLPLEGLFDPAPRRLSAVGDRVYLEQIAWNGRGGDNYGVDYTISRRSRLLPFLQKDLRVGRLYRTQCNTDAISAQLEEASRIVTLHCPPAAPGEPPVEEQIRLR